MKTTLLFTRNSIDDISTEPDYDAAFRALGINGDES